MKADLIFQINQAITRMIRGDSSAPNVTKNFVAPSIGSTLIDVFVDYEDYDLKLEHDVIARNDLSRLLSQ